MRGQQPDQDPFESPFAVTILPSSNKRGRRREPAAAQPPQPAAEAAPTARPAEVAPAHDPFIDAKRPTAGESPAATQPTQSTRSPVFGQPVPAFAAGATGFATPPASYGPPQPGYGPPAFEYPDAGAAAPEQTKKVRRPLVIALVVIVVLAALAALGVVAKARLTPAHRTVTIPPTLLGLPQDHSSTLDAATRTAQASLASLKGTFRNPQVAYFGRGVPALAVIAANVQTRPSASDRHQFFAGMAKKLGATITLHPVATGPFGGTMECGAANFAGTPATLCASLDSAAYVMVIAYNKKLVPAEATTRSVITAVEH